jgi:hypothetical protein
MKRNLLGCYLGQDLPHVRTGSSIFRRASKVILPFEAGKFTPLEDATILREVEEYGCTNETWMKLSTILNRSSKTIWSRYQYKFVFNRNTRTGKWLIQEDAAFLEHFFAGKKHSSREVITSIALHKLDAIAKELNRSSSRVNSHWMGQLKPALLSHHNGSLFTNNKPKFFSYLIEKKVTALQDIDWSEAKRLFPTENSKSLLVAIYCEMRKIDRSDPLLENEPLHVKLDWSKHDWINAQLPEKVKRYREKIVQLYDEIRGVQTN